VGRSGEGWGSLQAGAGGSGVGCGVWGVQKGAGRQFPRGHLLSDFGFIIEMIWWAGLAP
jgi:hypothetical protein